MCMGSLLILRKRVFADDVGNICIRCAVPPQPPSPPSPPPPHSPRPPSNPNHPPAIPYYPGTFTPMSPLPPPSSPPLPALLPSPPQVPIPCASVLFSFVCVPWTAQFLVCTASVRTKVYAGLNLGRLGIGSDISHRATGCTPCES